MASSTKVTPGGKHGGWRPGAGRKTNAERLARLIEGAETKIGEKLPDLINALVDLALNPDEKPEVRRKAIVDLITRVMGNPANRLEITGSGGGPIEMVAWAPSQEFIEAAESKKKELAAKKVSKLKGHSGMRLLAPAEEEEVR